MHVPIHGMYQYMVISGRSVSECTVHVYDPGGPRVRVKKGVVRERFKTRGGGGGGGGGGGWLENT